MANKLSVSVNHAAQSPIAPTAGTGNLSGGNLSSTGSTAQNIPKFNYNTTQTRAKESASDKIFNIVIYGIPECEQGTPRYNRISSDLTSVTATIQNLCPEITEDSIKDCTRLGKYKTNNNRPVLVKLVRSHDVSSILAKRHQIPARSSYSIKPLKTAEERANEFMLLKERRALIDSGVE